MNDDGIFWLRMDPQQWLLALLTAHVGWLWMDFQWLESGLLWKCWTRKTFSTIRRKCNKKNYFKRINTQRNLRMNSSPVTSFFLQIFFSFSPSFLFLSILLQPPLSSLSSLLFSWTQKPLTHGFYIALRKNLKSMVKIETCKK